MYVRLLTWFRSCLQLLEQQSRNEERVFWRNIPDQLLLAALPRHVAVLAAKAWRRWDRGGFWPFLTGRLRAWAEVKAFADRLARRFPAVAIVLYDERLTTKAAEDLLELRKAKRAEARKKSVPLAEVKRQLKI